MVRGVLHGIVEIVVLMDPNASCVAGPVPIDVRPLDAGVLHARGPDHAVDQVLVQDHLGHGSLQDQRGHRLAALLARSHSKYMAMAARMAMAMARPVAAPAVATVAIWPSGARAAGLATRVATMATAIMAMAICLNVAI